MKKKYKLEFWLSKGLVLTIELAKNIVPAEEIYLRVLKSNIPSCKSIPISYYISVDVIKHLHLFLYNEGATGLTEFQ